MKTDIKPYCLTESDIDDLEHGDDVRVRPYQSTAKTYGQGTNTGPSVGLNGEKVTFTWGQALTLSSAEGLGDPQKGTITIACIEICPNLFLTEDNYQTYITENTQP